MTKKFHFDNLRFPFVFIFAHYASVNRRIIWNILSFCYFLIHNWILISFDCHETFSSHLNIGKDWWMFALIYKTVEILMMMKKKVSYSLLWAIENFVSNNKPTTSLWFVLKTVSISTVSNNGNAKLKKKYRKLQQH